MALGNTLTTNWDKNGVPQSPVVTHRLLGPPPESDADFIDRHCLDLYNAITANPVATALSMESPELKLYRDAGWDDAEYCRQWNALIKGAA